MTETERFAASFFRAEELVEVVDIHTENPESSRQAHFANCDLFVPYDSYVGGRKLLASPPPTDRQDKHHAGVSECG